MSDEYTVTGCEATPLTEEELLAIEEQGEPVGHPIIAENITSLEDVILILQSAQLGIYTGNPFFEDVKASGLLGVIDED